MTTTTKTYDHLLKILLIGNSGVGKSAVLLRSVGEGFDENQLATIGVDFRVKFMSVKGKSLKLAVWDTAGQERFRTLTSTYYKGAHGIVLVYDVSDPESFKALNHWLGEIKKHSTNPNAILVLIANKIDRRPRPDDPGDGHYVTRTDGKDFAIEHSMLFVETSAKTNEGIDQAFEELVLKIVESNALRPTGEAEPLRLDEQAEEPSGGGGFCPC
eukprot:Protomagalhaensia_sp_Gyna_25__5131@NODE_598_length_3042_cov_141_403263_g429_i1_p2_GENE_NODE_598_length_3042_cov_141_403263_g429_i1NODE_598_length_3042_cov_141_403263_g429_i1_p2_ORF_typecomplete_len214_score26_29Ras/PF00071_22/3_5e54Roc/PF08477_13/1_3e24Arf/PF00025_21/7_3e22Gtr1_RagA/PF04670_12/8e09GTP_EFTU/PF00009_27/3_9e08SRPRB/PF09439_10/2_8e06AAA/PF00004_29/0_00024MMR_HSR1/PF01926_23/0_00062FeoB_N/PF02421_18/0_0041AIG1/PF04548_16/0_0039RsgA_GTPase/PF03193_16/1_5RsgA_GTPase/PF03193_16/61DUF815